ncbi:MAG: GatB/YqeY domain-containing protein [Candidatus Marinimicrobia bacterium]|nr:GatB/YqeY domain-containing protein [Candidatus Neomarinimicrobiota bacterium]
MVEAIKSRNDVKVGVIRLVRGMIRKLEIDRKKDFTDDDVIGVLSNAAKQRHEAIKAYIEGGRSRAENY